MEYASSPHDFKLMLASAGQAGQRHSARSLDAGAAQAVAGRLRLPTSLPEVLRYHRL